MPDNLIDQEETIRPKPKHRLSHTDPHAWVQDEGFATTADVALPKVLLDEVIGQDEAVAVARKAATQGRHLMLLGDPGTGKSMIAKAMAEIMPERRLDDVLVYPNPKDQNRPITKVTPGGSGRDEHRAIAKKAETRNRIWSVAEWAIALGLVVVGVWAYFTFGGTNGLIAGILTLLVALFFLFVARQSRGRSEAQVPNLLVERSEEAVPAPYVDATGSHAGALFGDIRHDPFQSGGLQTPVHQRVEPGAIHRANKGLLFIDEINTLRLDSQQALLSAMQDKQYAISGRSDKSAGAMSRTDPVPCHFILVAAGNMDVIQPTDAHLTGIHPALRSRIRGYGYEVYVHSSMHDTDANRRKLVRFVAQEVRRDGNIPHFEPAAVAEVIREAQRRSGHSGSLTLRLRELGGLVRTAGDLARYEDHDIVTIDHVVRAKKMSMSLEHQVTKRDIEITTAREAAAGTDACVGLTAGCAVIGTGETGEAAGIVVPIEAAALHPMDTHRGEVLIGGGLEGSPGLADNLSALLKRLQGENASRVDMHVQALLQETNADIAALGAASAVAAVSALENVPVRRDTAVIGALSVTGRLRAVDNITQMIEGAADRGYTQVVVPRANSDDVLLAHGYADRIEVHYVDDLDGALALVLEGKVPTIGLGPLRGAWGQMAMEAE